MWNCQNPYVVESEMADDAQIFNLLAPTSLEQQKLETANVVCAPMMMGSFDGMQNTRPKGT